MTEQTTHHRFQKLWGREMNATEREFFRLREDEGYRGWFNWETGRAESDKEVQADLEKRWAKNEAAGLTYSREHGWIEKEQAR